MIRILPICLAFCLILGPAPGLAQSKSQPTLDLTDETLQDQQKGILADIEAFRQKNGRLPQSLKEVYAPDDGVVDPWKTPWQYRMLDESAAGRTGLEFVIESAGPDKKFGTPDDASFPTPDPNFQPSPIMQNILGTEEEKKE